MIFEEIWKYTNTTCVHELKDLISLRHQYYVKWSTDSFQSLSKSQGFFCRKRKISPKICMYCQGTLNRQRNIEQQQQQNKFTDFTYSYIKIYYKIYYKATIIETSVIST